MSKKSKKVIELSEVELMLAEQQEVLSGIIKQAKTCGIKREHKAWLKSFVGITEPSPIPNGMMAGARSQIAEAMVEKLDRGGGTDCDQAAIVWFRDRRWCTDDKSAELDRRQAAKDVRSIAKRLAPSAMLALQPSILWDNADGERVLKFSFAWNGLLLGRNLHADLENRVQAQSRSMQPIGSNLPIAFERIDSSPKSWCRAMRVMWSLTPKNFGLDDEAAVAEAAAFRLAMLLGSTNLHRLTLGIGEGEEVLRAGSRVNKAWAAGHGSWEKTLAHPDRIPRDLARIMNAAGFDDRYALPFVKLR